MGRFNPASYKGKQLWASLRRLKDEDGFPVVVLAALAGTSVSRFYRYIHSACDEAEMMPGHELFALAEGLAREHANYRLVQLVLPAGASIVVDQAPAAPNGLTDEYEDAAVATAQLVMAHRTTDPDVVERQADVFAELSTRCRAEAGQMRAQRETRPVRRVS